MFCLDTNVAIAYLNRKPEQVVLRFQREVLIQALALPTVALFELQYGVAKSSRRTESEHRLALFLQLPIAIWPFETEDAVEAGEIRAALAKGGTPIGPYDILIAAQARRRSAILVTANTREFARVSGLQIEDWTSP